MKIYRLEHKESKLGFWFHGNKFGNNYKYTVSGKNIKRRCSNYDNHPDTLTDFGYSVANMVFDKEWVHGCHTLNHFFAWFEKDWYELIEYGFGLFEYDVEDKSQYIVGKSQIVFNQQAAINVREISVEEYKEALQ